MEWKNTVNHEGEDWVLFTEVLQAAQLADPKAANQKCEAEPVILRIALPQCDQRERYMKMRDVPHLLARYSRITPEQRSAFDRILSGQNLVEPEVSNAGITGKMREKCGKVHTENASGSIWKMRGDRWGDFYASSFVAYFALTCLVIALAVLHASAGMRMLPALPPWEILALSLLMQSIVLVGTVNARIFKQEQEYRYFLFGFAAYDTLMSACNFFYAYDPSAFYNPNAGAARIIQGITELGIRTGFTIAFPMATVFFASLVKKMRE